MTLVYRIKILDEMDLHLAIHKAALEFGKVSKDVVKTAMLKTSVSELGHNILKYAQTGTIYIYEICDPKKGIQVIASDKGPGIVDIEKALTDNYSSSGTLGLGLPGVKRMADAFSLVSEVNQGTTVSITFFV